MLIAGIGRFHRRAVKLRARLPDRDRVRWIPPEMRTACLPSCLPDCLAMSLRLDYLPAQASMPRVAAMCMCLGSTAFISGL